MTYLVYIVNKKYKINYTKIKIVCYNTKQLKKRVSMNLEENKVTFTDVMEGLKKIEDSSINVIICDPPYNIGKDFLASKDNLSMHDYKEWSNTWLKEFHRVLTKDGVAFVYGFSEILAHLLVLAENNQFNIRWLIWHYTNKNVPSLNFWQRSHESILCIYKEKPIFNKDDVREEYTETFLKNSVGKTRKSTIGRFSDGSKSTIYKAHEQGALPRDVIKIPALAGGAGLKERWFFCKNCNQAFSPIEAKNHKDHETIKHPTQKPLLLTEKLLKASLPKIHKKYIGKVLIPFAGSGSECVACKKLKVDFIAFDNSPIFIQLANDWIKYEK